MKRGITVFIWILLLPVYSCRTGSGEESEPYRQDAEYIQIVLFHLEQRCESCIAVEEETKRVLREKYAEEMQTGNIKFISLDFQSENGKQAARLLRASGQTLYVVKGDRIENLTSPAFMYASTHPEIYREALRKTLDKYLE